MTIDREFGTTQSFPISWLHDPRQHAQALGDKHPKILYHYTNDVGLRGIVSPPSWDINYPGLARAAQLWATDVRYMNDARELLFAAEPMVERLRAAAADSSVPRELAAAMSRLADTFSDGDVLRWKLGCFAVCLSDSGDVVNQWQGYAGRGGYAIGFSWDVLAEHSQALHPGTTVMGTTPSPVGLRRMSYDTPAAVALADSWVAGLRTAYDQDGNFMGMLIKSGNNSGMIFVATLMLGDLATVKHGDFQHEREWRLIALSEPGYPSKTRQRGGEDVPYLDIAANMDETGAKPTIARLVVGPGPDQQGRIAAARELLEERGHDPNVVVGYDGPLRW